MPPDRLKICLRLASSSFSLSLSASPLPKNPSPAAFAALSASARGSAADHRWVSGKDNAVRISSRGISRHLEVNLRDARRCRARRCTRCVPSHIVLDRAALSDTRCTLPPPGQRNRTLENYEGLAMGPTLDDGRR
jgi:hypothetical protein